MHRPAYPYLSLGRAPEFSVAFGLNDDDWLARNKVDADLSDDGPQTSLQLV
jgi:hypothetical protein